MPKSLIVPGVSVSAQFDVAPPLPARSGILGCVGVVDRADAGVTSATTREELVERYGPATRFSLPEAFSALGNGVSEVVVSPVLRSGTPATTVLLDDEGQEVVKLRARAAGPWGNQLSVRVARTMASDGKTVRSVRVEVFYRGERIEVHDGLIFRESDDQEFFTVINRDSAVLVATDPVYDNALPVTSPELVALVDSQASAAIGSLSLGNAPLVNLAAQTRGEVGNRISLKVEQGQALAVLNAGDKPSMLVRAREPGDGGSAIQIEVADAGADGVDVRVFGSGGALRAYRALKSIKAAVDALNTDPEVEAEKQGNLVPTATAARIALAASRTVTLTEEGGRTATFANMLSAKDIVAALTNDKTLVATLVGDEADLPDAGAANSFYLQGGRDKGLARAFATASDAKARVLELVPAPDSDGRFTRLQLAAGSLPGTVRLTVGVDLGDGNKQRERFDNLVMDPDSANYLPAVLDQQSALLRAHDRFERAGASEFPAQTASPVDFSGGTAPLLADYENAIDALALEDAVDLVLAGVQGFEDPSLDGVAVHRALLAHSIAQADAARPRIAIGSVRPDANDKVQAILDHAAQVANRRFVLVTPAGTEGAIAGLLGHLEFFQSPTFKSVASPGAPLVVYSDGELNKLVGPDGNVCVIQQRRGRGTICIKGIASDGFQISVTRVADRCIREVKAIADRFIGELNNAESRNALKQMIVATFTQLERDGALVPSVDGKSPAFLVDVYASQNDAAGGIVRIDIAVRPVRAIDYVYATIRVKN